MEGAERNEVVARALVGLTGVSQKQRLISSVTSLGWLVTHVRCSGDEGVKSDYGGMICREYHCKKAATWSL